MKGQSYCDRTATTLVMLGAHFRARVQVVPRSVAQYSKTTPHRVPFWFKPVSTFGLLKLTTFNGSSHTLVVSTHPLLLSALVLADSALPRGLAYRMSGGYVVPRASHRAVTGSACPGRERLMEQPVSSGRTFSFETETQATCRSHENVLCNVQSVCRSIHLGPPFLSGRVETPLWHIDAVWFWRASASLSAPRSPKGGRCPFHLSRMHLPVVVGAFGAHPQWQPDRWASANFSVFEIGWAVRQAFARFCH